MASTRTAHAVWHGTLKEGEGSFEAESGRIAGAYSFSSRFEDGDGATNPEELLAAAHAACFSMAFANALDGAGHPADNVKTTANVHLGTKDGDPHIGKVELVCKAIVPGIGDEEFHSIAEAAKAGCPVSKLFAGAEITLDAALAN